MELLVVISIIGFLLALLAPTLLNMQSHARTALCGNNLRRIGEAVQARLGSGKEVETLTPFGWPNEVGTFIGNTEILMCPEADESEAAGGVHEPIKQFIRIAYDNNPNRMIEFVESGNMVKASQAQYEKYAEFAGGEGLSLRRVWESGEGYIDDGSGIFYWGYEDAGVGGDDYQDVCVKVTQYPNGWSEIQCTSATSGRPVIQDVNTGEFLVTVEEFNRYLYGGTVANGKIVHIQSGGGAGVTNYAINEHNIGKYEVGRIVALDYAWTIARTGDEWDTPRFDSDGNNRPDFARHGGRTNVLFSGGSVALMRTDDINPATSSQVQDTYWLP